MLGHEHDLFIEILTENDVDAVLKGLLEDWAKGWAKYCPIQQVFAVKEAWVTSNTFNKWVSS